MNVNPPISFLSSVLSPFSIEGPLHLSNVSPGRKSDLSTREVLSFLHSLMISPPDPSLLLIFSWFKTVIGVFSIIFAFISTILVLFFSGRTSSEYRYCLITVVISAAISDMNLHYFFTPIPILPLPCLYTDGLLQSMGVSSGISFVSWIITVVCNAPPYMACFLYRHQVVLLPRSPFKLPFFAKYAIVGVLYIYFCAHGPLFWYFLLTPDEISSYRKIHFLLWPSSISQSINCFNDNILYAVYVVILTVSLCVLVLSSICYHIFSILAHHSSMSNSVRKYNRTMTRMLLVQALVPCVFILLPVVMICVQVVVNFETYVNPLLSVDIAGLHSLMHSLVMISTSKNYRTVLSNLVFRLLGRSGEFSISTGINTHDAHTVFLVKSKLSVLISPLRNVSTSNF